MCAVRTPGGPIIDAILDDPGNSEKQWPCCAACFFPVSAQAYWHFPYSYIGHVTLNSLTNNFHKHLIPTWGLLAFLIWIIWGGVERDQSEVPYQSLIESCYSGMWRPTWTTLSGFVVIFESVLETKFFFFFKFSKLSIYTKFSKNTLFFSIECLFFCLNYQYTLQSIGLNCLAFF